MNKRSGSRERLAAIPSVDRLLQQPALVAAASAHGRSVVLDAVREVLAEQRTALKQDASAPASPEELVDATLRRLSAASAPSLRPVFNLTGTVLHTNLGRAAAAAGSDRRRRGRRWRAPVNLEFDLDGGERGERDATSSRCCAAHRRRGGDGRQQQRRRACCWR